MRTRCKTSLVRVLSALCAAGGTAACSSLLDVKNPNNVNATDLNNAAVAPAIANGALSATAYAWGAMLTEYATATDELTWIGSRDGFRQLDVGILKNPTNEFTDAAFPFVGQARWMADFAIKQLSTFDAAGTLKNRDDLARSYLYAGLMYMMIADQFNNFPIASDRQSAAPPVGPDKMGGLYDVAIGYATTGLGIAVNKSLRTALLALRARSAHAKAVWAMLHPPGQGVPYGGNPLVNDPGAVADARAAIFLADSVAKTVNWKFRFSYSNTTTDNYIGAWVNGRQEMRIGDRYINRTAKDTLRDPVSRVVDPEIRRAAVEFIGTSSTQLYSPLTALSERELHLILAEAALARGDTIAPADSFSAHINYRRALDVLPLYATAKDTAATYPKPLDILKYERMANLFLQGRRLEDEYRFNIPADLWLPGTDAVVAPGTLFPITQVELLSNPFCVSNPASC